MVEQDFLISQAVAAIFEDKFLKGQNAALAHLKVEVNTNENRSFFPLVPVKVQVPGDGGAVRAST